ncbi:hypothetical protein Vqi01_28100 [Micromonospora qiuiae]|uniref:Uncharacterized protein n=1 Tax=Micromonospora qiuiae TaxID=502268 RepID=A0ABQ4JC19_9ACTN|nr:hypothetical protein Vqi01_28100 [Micromonospora qiuiae]
MDDLSELLSANEEVLVGQPAPAVLRPLGNGGTHRVVKVFHEPNDLAKALEGIGWSACIRPVGTTLIAGSAMPQG